MAVTKAKKAEQIEKLSADLKGVDNVVLATFSKLTVNQDFELRRARIPATGEYGRAEYRQKPVKSHVRTEAVAALGRNLPQRFGAGNPVAARAVIQPSSARPRRAIPCWRSARYRRRSRRNAPGRRR